MEECLAATGVNITTLLATGSFLLVFSLVLLHPFIRRRINLLVTPFLLIAVVGASGSPVAAAEACPASARPDMSTGRQGEVQLFNVIQNDTPSEGATFIASSLRLALADNPLPGSTLSTDGKTGTAPGEGVYEALGDGRIRFTPEPSFVGPARGVKYSIKDTKGYMVTSSYRPIVVGGSLASPLARDDILPYFCARLGLAVGGWVPFYLDEDADGCASECHYDELGNKVCSKGANPAAVEDQHIWKTKLLANDEVREAGASFDPSTVDLNPSVPGVQQSYTGSGFLATYDPTTDTLTVTTNDPKDYAPAASDPERCNDDLSVCEPRQQKTDIVLRYTFRDTNGSLSNQATARHPGNFAYLDAPL